MNFKMKSNEEKLKQLYFAYKTKFMVYHQHWLKWYNLYFQGEISSIIMQLIHLNLFIIPYHNQMNGDPWLQSILYTAMCVGLTNEVEVRHLLPQKTMLAPDSTKQNSVINSEQIVVFNFVCWLHICVLSCKVF